MKTCIEEIIAEAFLDNNSTLFYFSKQHRDVCYQMPPLTRFSFSHQPYFEVGADESMCDLFIECGFDFSQQGGFTCPFSQENLFKAIGPTNYCSIKFGNLFCWGYPTKVNNNIKHRSQIEYTIEMRCGGFQVLTMDEALSHKDLRHIAFVQHKLLLGERDAIERAEIDLLQA